MELVMRAMRTAILIVTSAALLRACSRPSETPVNTSPNPVPHESQGAKSGFTESTGGDNDRDATGASSNRSDPYGKRPEGASQNPSRDQSPAKPHENKSSQQ
jgi:hypothetical protein